MNADGILSPVSALDDDAPVIRYRPDYATERRAAGVIRMGEW